MLCVPIDYSLRSVGDDHCSSACKAGYCIQVCKYRQQHACSVQITIKHNLINEIHRETDITERWLAGFEAQPTCNTSLSDSKGLVYTRQLAVLIPRHFDSEASLVCRCLAASALRSGARRYLRHMLLLQLLQLLAWL
jgi:hypothetical protein